MATLTSEMTGCILAHGKLSRSSEYMERAAREVESRWKEHHSDELSAIENSDVPAKQFTFDFDEVPLPFVPETRETSFRDRSAPCQGEASESVIDSAQQFQEEILDTVPTVIDEDRRQYSVLPPIKYTIHQVQIGQREADKILSGEVPQKEMEEAASALGLKSVEQLQDFAEAWDITDQRLAARLNRSVEELVDLRHKTKEAIHKRIRSVPVSAGNECLECGSPAISLAEEGGEGMCPECANKAINQLYHGSPLGESLA